MLGAVRQTGEAGTVPAHQAHGPGRRETPLVRAGARSGQRGAAMSAQASGAKSGASGPVAASAKAVTIARSVTVRELADMLDASPIDIIKELMKKGVMAAINQAVQYEAAAAVARELGFEPQPEERAGAVVERREAGEEEAHLQPRPPIVTVMGHVDHGKTSLLDAIRQTKVTEEEVGAITQRIGAYQVEVFAKGESASGGNGQKITFIDTPGHEAFTAMRARGATVTDIAVLVVAADDGVMPQTLEAIHHAKAAGVPIIVAINKIDLPSARPDRVKQQLAEHEVLIEEYGGDVIAIPVSAKTKEGVQDLLEHILLVAEISELKANPDRPAEGTIIESKKDPSRGPMVTVLTQKGTLHVGDVIVAGDTFGKVKAMFDGRGQRLEAATPSTPAEVMGLDAVPPAGETITVVPDEHIAREIVEARERAGAEAAAGRAVTLEAVSGAIAAGRVKDLNVVVKADSEGSLEAIQASLERLSTETVRLNIVHAGVGNVSESDVMLALASKAIIVGFTVRVEPGGRRLAESEGVDIRHYQIIYELIEDLDKAVKGLIEPVVEEVVDGHAEVRAIFRVRGGRIAGCYLTDGLVRRNSLVRVRRGAEVMHTSRVASLRRFQEDVREVAAGFECGIGVEKFDDFQEGDIIEAFHTERRG
ncbi:MAG: translation initiation factor IF-2 [Chloroflexi bacterium]|nr:translation initiation factor IF-2 [Chloroflexota bacterium]